MSDKLRSFAAWLACCVFFLSSLGVSAADGQTEEKLRGVMYQNPDTGYVVLVEDDAGLLSEEELAALARQMQEITVYGNAAFKTIAENESSTRYYAGSYYYSAFASRSGMLFLIDMDNRNIWIYCDGAVYKTITEDYADTITDNVYLDAHYGNYYECASKTFKQAAALLDGHRIIQPMKYICNALLALLIALLFNFGLVNIFSWAHKTGDKELLAHTLNYFSNTDPTVCYQYQDKVYDPRTRGRSGGGGSGGGGGGFSGGGGGHGF